MNPCPCGFLTDPDKDCICTPNQITNYRGRLSGPMGDRIDMFFEVPKVKTDDFTRIHADSENSESIRNRVQQARDVQLLRFAGTGIFSNSEMKSKDIKLYCEPTPDATEILQNAVKALDLSARSYYRILKLSRTIADLSQSEKIQAEHILEALSYRKKEI